MKTRHIGLIGAALLAVFLAALLAAGQKNDQAELALKAAIKTETVDGNLKGAIELYKKIAAQPGAGRATVATALLRMGQCYEKLGNTEARTAYERLVRDYADQAGVAAEARARLAVLNNTARGSAMAVRRVWEGPEVDIQGGVSWDGRYLSFNNWNPGNIALRNLATGDTRDLTKNADRNQYPLYPSLISPDGKLVAYTWVDAASAYSVRLIGTDGRGQRVLYSNTDLYYIELGAWSPDGTSLAAILTKKDKTNQIALISAGDGSSRVLKLFDTRFPQPRGFSPDGRFLAYDCPEQENPKHRGIFVLATDGSGETPLMLPPAWDQLLGWTLDGRGILFESDRTGSAAFWFIRVVDGKPEGSPEIIRTDAGDLDTPLGFTRSGSFYYATRHRFTDAYIATIDPAVSRVVTVPSRISERFIGTNSLPVFSPDGQSVGYFSKRTAPSSGNVLCIRSFKTGGELELKLEPDLLNFGGPRWSPDGQAILVIGIDLQSRQGLYRVDTRTGRVTSLLHSEPETFTWGQWAPDGTSLVLWRNVFSDKTSRLLSRDLATGQEREIYRAPLGTYLFNVVISPDGSEFGLTLLQTEGKGYVKSLAVLPVRGGDAQDILRLKGDEDLPRNGLTWTPDGKYLVYAKSVESAGRTRLELWRVSPRDKEPQNVGLLATNATVNMPGFVLHVHPDGRSIAFSTAQTKQEVWVMENFLPPLKVAK